MQIFSTTLRSADDRIIVIPNSKIISSEVINLTREPNRRTQIMVGVADADIDKGNKCWVMLSLKTNVFNMIKA